jgi:acyl-CoA synthetase (AMP-forming)/AMP-acid ligase II
MRWLTIFFISWILMGATTHQHNGDFCGIKNTAFKTREGHGTCIGHPIENIKVKIIKSHDEIISKLSDATILSTHEIGEIIVQGVTVTREYLQLPLETTKSKIVDDDNKFWHRMGDVGFLDENGLLWFCGRKAHCVKTTEGILYPIQCEAIFNQHPQVRKSALVGLGPDDEKTPAIVIERKDDQFLQGKSRSIFESELLTLAKKYPHTKNISKIYYSTAFPVDVRHNIKIDRLALKREIEENENEN